MMTNGDDCIITDGHAEWLSQGDVFRSVPIAFTSLTEGEFRAGHSLGPALLFTHDCVLDKRNRAGYLTIERLHFLPLRTTDGLDAHRVANLRGTAHQLRPFERMYLGEVADLGECFVTMSSPASVPSGYFALTPVPVAGGSEDRRACAQRNDSRFGRLREPLMPLLHAKWNAYWTRLVYEDHG